MMRDFCKRLARVARKLDWRNTSGMRTDPDLHLLAPILQTVLPLPPPVGLLERIEAQIDDEAMSPEGSDTLAPTNRIVVRTLITLLALVALSFTMLTVTRQLSRPTDCAPAALAILDLPSISSQLRIEAVECARYLRLHHHGLKIPNGRALELWLYPQGGHVPASLGLLVAKGDVTILPVNVAFAHADTFAVSIEPNSGSPFDRPSGPIISRARAVNAGFELRSRKNYWRLHPLATGSRYVGQVTSTVTRTGTPP